MKQAHADGESDSPDVTRKGRREVGKDERRARVIDAARQMIARHGDSGFSMKLLAKRAAVSLVTPYNLFGSKNDVIVALLRDEMAQFAEIIDSWKGASSVDRVFKIIDVSADLHARDPSYFSSLVRMSYTGVSGRTRQAMAAARVTYWRYLIQAAIDDGSLLPTISADSIVTALGHVYASTILDHALGNISIARFRSECSAGFALILYAVASRSVASSIWTRLLQSETALAS